MKDVFRCLILLPRGHNPLPETPPDSLFSVVPSSTSPSRYVNNAGYPPIQFAIFSVYWKSSAKYIDTNLFIFIITYCHFMLSI